MSPGDWDADGQLPPICPSWWRHQPAPLRSRYPVGDRLTSGPEGSVEAPNSYVGYGYAFQDDEGRISMRCRVEADPDPDHPHSVTVENEAGLQWPVARTLVARYASPPPFPWGGDA